MQTAPRGTTLALVMVLGGCGVPPQKYNTQVARAEILTKHLQKKLERIDYLEAKEALARRKTRQARTDDVKRLTRLATEIARVRTALNRTKRDLASCRSTNVSRVPLGRSVPMSLTLRASKCHRQGVTVVLGAGLLVRAGGPAGQRAGAQKQIRTALSRQLAPIARCYLKATTRRTGRLLVTLRLNKRGRARKVRAAPGGLGARRAVKCVLKALRRLRVTGLKGPAFAAVPLRFGRSKVFVTSCRKHGTRSRRP